MRPNRPTEETWISLMLAVFSASLQAIVDVGCRGAFQHQHGLARHQHAAAPEAVDQLCLVGIDAGDDLGGDHLRVDAVSDAQAQPVEDHVARLR